MPIGIHGALTALLLLLASKVRPFALNKPGINGLLNVYKPYGLSSADVTNKIKSIIAENSPTKKKLVHIMRRRHIQVGHGGTLDKYTEGVLAVGIGTATKALTKFLKGRRGSHLSRQGVRVYLDVRLRDRHQRHHGWRQPQSAGQDRALGGLEPHLGPNVRQGARQHDGNSDAGAKKVAGKPMYKLALRGRAVERRLSFVNVMEIVRLDGEEVGNS